MRWLIIAIMLIQIHFLADESTTVLPRRQPQVQSEFGTNAPDCWHLYDNGNHREWADCIGAGYVSD